MNDVRWRKSSFSGGNGGGCVEVADEDGYILVRDTKDHGCGPVHRYTPAEWRAFVSGVRNGEFDLDDSGHLPPRDLAMLPAPSGADDTLSGAAAFLFEMGHLKHLSRAGWLLLGIPQPESVAEHSFRAGMVAIVLAAMEGADVGRTAALALMHDAHETRIGDVPSVGRAYVSTAAPEAVTVHQTSGMPSGMAKVVQELTAEYEANETAEAQLAHDADKIETLLQAMEYQASGYAAGPWRETSLTALRTHAGRELARSIGSADPHGWWSAFAASYAELRASTRAVRPDRKDA